MWKTKFVFAVIIQKFNSILTDNIIFPLHLLIHRTTVDIYFSKHVKHSVAKLINFEYLSRYYIQSILCLHYFKIISSCSGRGFRHRLTHLLLLKNLSSQFNIAIQWFIHLLRIFNVLISILDPRTFYPERSYGCVSVSLWTFKYALTASSYFLSNSLLTAILSSYMLCSTESIVTSNLTINTQRI
jgi:hypothetical protein